MDAVDYHDCMLDDHDTASVSQSAPQSEADLLLRCQQIAGMTVGQLAAKLNRAVPQDLSRHKGWLGQLIEQILGADAGSQALQDFTALGIELKTLPLNAMGEPKESTYVCTVSLTQNGEMHWQDSWVRRKLAKVLWLPVEADPDIPLAQRFIGQAILWQPSAQQDAQLKSDWEELMDQIVLGGQQDISAKSGEYLQIRPKAANSQVTARATGSDGIETALNPKGFYLRPCFTRQILAADNVCC